MTESTHRFYSRNENATEGGAERAHHYEVLQSHGFRELHRHVVMYRELAQWSDEKIAEHPKTVRMCFEEMVYCADEWYQNMMGAFAVSDEHLDEYVRYRTHPEWRRLMEESGMVWNPESCEWVE